MFSKYIGLNIRLAKIFDIYYNVLQIYNNKDIKLFFRNFINISLKLSQSIKKNKKYKLILEKAIIDPKNYLLFIAIINFHPIISISNI